MVETDLIPTPRDIYELHKFLTLTEDVMFVSGIAFLNTLLSKTRFFTVGHIPFCMDAQINISLTKIVNIYTRLGFNVQVVFMDMEFEKFPGYLELVQVNTTAAI